VLLFSIEVIKTQIPLFIAVILRGYILLYRFDLSRPFHLCKRDVE